jgi:glycogen debranching enzyme
MPEVARNTLVGVLENGPSGPEIGGQYWDRIIWIAGAWHHYLVTGDREFLALAVEAGGHSWRRHEEEEFDAEVGLFRGGACFQDGVAGYPDRYARTGGSSNILDWVAANPSERVAKGHGLPVMACSTNCLYYAAYRDYAAMLDALGRDGADAYREKAANLKVAFREIFWDAERGGLFYLIDELASCEHQEGFGSSFALLFDLLDEEEGRQILASQYVTEHGLPCVWPSFARYDTPDGMGFGRHSGPVWPQVQGFWAEACARRGRLEMMEHELLSLTEKACRDAQFTEIYHPLTGEIYGGRQERDPDGVIAEWESCMRQTWSATAYLRIILHGLLGMRFEETGIRFEPALTSKIERLRVDGIAYRDVVLSIAVVGAGRDIKSVKINGETVSEAWIPTTFAGGAHLEITLG